MRAVIVGRPDDRARLRAQLENTPVEVVGEFATLGAARASTVGADAVIIATANGLRPGALSTESLTPREAQVLELMAEGLSNKGIARILGISDQTVKFHVSSIAGKLGASNRTDAVRRAARRGLITL
jgi:DNA-binding CsgD family transcriptional regulator